MDTTIYYFSGTGNSLHIANDLGSRLPGSRLIPIVSLLKNPRNTAAARRVGFVFPIYYMTIPKPVKRFIAALDLRAVEYTFAIATRMGTAHNAFSEIDRALRRQARRLDAHFSLTMGSNDPKYDQYQSPTEEKIHQLETAFTQELDRIQGIVEAGQTCREADTTVSEPVPDLVLKVVPFMNSIFRPVGELFGFKSHFYADERCGGCGTCRRVCLSGRIHLVDGKPAWQKGIECFYCYACLNYCPKAAVQIKGWTEENGRYAHPYATVEQIARQKTWAEEG